MNNGYLSQCRVIAVVMGISVDAEEDAVLVQVYTNLGWLFPSAVPDAIATEEGFAEIRVLIRRERNYLLLFGFSQDSLH